MPAPARHFAASSSSKIPKDVKADKKKEPESEKNKASTKATAGDDVDPLDAFMSNMEGELKEDLSLAGSGLKRKYEDYSSGVETSKGSTNGFDDHAANWSSTKGAVSFEARKAWVKKMNRMRGEPSDSYEPPPE
mmetsp:Transcript_22202/g.40859  ORF Transcript_22202/g.40859 Transcript_22202/m.40859 type:complete len:134 (-) Transcript_22202:1-402(-)